MDVSQKVLCVASDWAMSSSLVMRSLMIPRTFTKLSAFKAIFDATTANTGLCSLAISSFNSWSTRCAAAEEAEPEC